MKLRKLQIKDISGMLEWMTDPNLAKNFRFNPLNQDEEKIKKFILNSYGAQNKHFAITDESDEYLGTVSLKEIDYENKTAEYAISLRACAIGTGVATFATKEILKKAFYEYNLNRVYLNVLSENIRAQKFYDKIGFVYEGEFKQHIVKNDEFRDLKWYAILKKDFEG